MERKRESARRTEKEQMREREGGRANETTAKVHV